MVRHIYATLVVQPLSIQAYWVARSIFVGRKWQNQSSTIWTAPQTMLWPTFRRALCGITGVFGFTLHISARWSAFGEYHCCSTI